MVENLIYNIQSFSKTSKRFEEKSILHSFNVKKLELIMSSLRLEKTERYGTSTTYFDTPDLKLLKQKKEGDYYKTKLRIRKYSNSKEFRLELKQKEGKQGFKQYKQFHNYEEAILFLKRNSLCLLNPTIEINYLRNGYTLRDPVTGNLIRITIDLNIKGKRYGITKTLNKCIIEIKFEEDSTFIKKVKSHLNFSPISFSKYEEFFKCF